MSAFYGYSLFHLNLAFSSVEEEDRSTIIEKCYWPLLNLAEKHKWPFAIEASAYTLEEVEKRDPKWIAKLRDLQDTGIIEFVGAGYSQMIGPIVPAKVVEKNLEIGHEVYERLLGKRPTLALVNEQAYSAGLVAHYKKAGYKAIFMDWDSCYARHPEWDAEWRYQPQIAQGNNASLPLLWTNTITFQKLQRLAHGEMTAADYVDYISGQKSEKTRILPLYGNDIEIFDFRPGRFQTEAATSSESEWLRIENAYESLEHSCGLTFLKPSAALEMVKPEECRELQLETAAYPIPVKKQHKYNVTRWAVTGRNDLGINTECWRIYAALSADEATPQEDWKELCYLWASDFRTHITEKRWSAFRERLNKKKRKPKSAPLALVNTDVALSWQEQDTMIDIRGEHLHLRLNKRRGLAIESFALDGEPDTRPLCGTLGHGYYDDIGHGFDWYSGNATLESPGAPKVADLNPANVKISHDKITGCLLVQGNVNTPLGAIQKNITIHPDQARIDFHLIFDWKTVELGSLRLGNITLVPEAFDRAKLTFRTHNGGYDPETFKLNGGQANHGAPVTFLVSATSGLGMTEGWIDVGDENQRLRLDVDMATAALLGMVNYGHVGDKIFCRLSLSALELDETRKSVEAWTGPQEYRFSLTGILNQP